MGFLPRRSKASYDEELAQRIREVIGPRPDVTERQMFGGLAFLLHGNMACGVVRDDLMVRVGPDAHDDALQLPGARPMDFTGRPMRGMVYVDRAGRGDTASLAAWVERGLAYAGSKPAK